MNYQNIISNRRITKENINSKIKESESFIKERIGDIFTDVGTAKQVGEELIKLSALKEAMLIMETVDYKIYESEGKLSDWVTWKMMLNLKN